MLKGCSLLKQFYILGFIASWILTSCLPTHKITETSSIATPSMDSSITATLPPSRVPTAFLPVQTEIAQENEKPVEHFKVDEFNIVTRFKLEDYEKLPYLSLDMMTNPEYHAYLDTQIEQGTIKGVRSKTSAIPVDWEFQGYGSFNLPFPLVLVPNFTHAKYGTFTNTSKRPTQILVFNQVDIEGEQYIGLIMEVLNLDDSVTKIPMVFPLIILTMDRGRFLPPDMNDKNKCVMLVPIIMPWTDEYEMKIFPFKNYYRNVYLPNKNFYDGAIRIMGKDQNSNFPQIFSELVWHAGFTSTLWRCSF